MRIVHKKKLRRVWANHPAITDLLLERDIRIGSCRLRAKLLVFRTRTAMRHFWKDGLKNGELGRRCAGVVNGFRIDVTKYRGEEVIDRYVECDPRYFCVIGLVKGFLSMEVICHESMHAGFAYAKRVRRSPWDARALEFDEEAICYPAGLIAEGINTALREVHL